MRARSRSSLKANSGVLGVEVEEDDVDDGGVVDDDDDASEET